VTRILVVEDNENLAFGLRNNLEIEGYEVVIAEDGKAGLAMFEQAHPDLVILDLMLPGTDGFRVLRTLREKGHVTPILVLTARGEESDKVRGLRFGADDYVTKPFGLLELLARVEALLRRTQPGRNGAQAAVREMFRFGSIEIDVAARAVRRGPQAIELAPKEFDLLLSLLKARGAVVSRLRLLREVWGYSSAVVTRTVDTHIAELRRKLEENPSSPQHIITVRKSGYRIRG
jgi:two-component system alkaline phosphatase synthesis response regulator PhoP